MRDLSQLPRETLLATATHCHTAAEFVRPTTTTGGLASGQRQDQDDPCKTKSKVVGDATYCDRYWECVNNQAELYDCPNGLVFAGKRLFNT
ncbi:conserved hypothetical protein [Culex quinquefasciatus]|uniref:Chitin-binding type-2 domain-containing protein n=1 Tax=Culex quinquefasciatus TaxID=7176 RepID=B0XFV1_CULQU|nr:conserved hypothetical protein [Culex quinquefasciatus]|eukprot:XP_001868523.1 conserved hypothetical protein [Culex quinquefasciatus]